MKFHFFLYLLILFSLKSKAQKLISLNPNQSKYDLVYQSIEVFEDPTTQLTFQEIQQKKFIQCTKKLINSGYSNSKLWYRFEIENNSDEKWIFVVKGTLIDKIEFFEIKKDGNFRKRVSGDHYPFSSREIESPMFCFYMNLKKK